MSRLLKLTYPAMASLTLSLPQSSSQSSSQSLSHCNNECTQTDDFKKFLGPSSLPKKFMVMKDAKITENTQKILKDIKLIKQLENTDNTKCLINIKHTMESYDIEGNENIIHTILYKYGEFKSDYGKIKFSFTLFDKNVIDIYMTSGFDEKMVNIKIINYTPEILRVLTYLLLENGAFEQFDYEEKGSR